MRGVHRSNNFMYDFDALICMNIVLEIRYMIINIYLFILFNSFLAFESVVFRLLRHFVLPILHTLKLLHLSMFLHRAETENRRISYFVYFLLSSAPIVSELIYYVCAPRLFTNTQCVLLLCENLIVSVIAGGKFSHHYIYTH